MPVEDNLDQVAQMLDELATLIDFTEPGANGSLGETLIDTVVGAIADRNAQEVDPDGVSWDVNQGKYGQAKQERGLPIGVGLREGGEMVSLQQLRGEVQITADEAIVRYGTDTEARRKAQWFTNGSDGTDGEPSGASNQPPRPFFAMSDEDVDAVVDQTEQFVDEWIGRL